MRMMLTMANIVYIIILRHCERSVYKIYTVFKLFESAVCSARFDFFEISTPVTHIMLTMGNIV